MMYVPLFINRKKETMKEEISITFMLLPFSPDVSICVDPPCVSDNPLVVVIIYQSNMTTW